MLQKKDFIQIEFTGRTKEGEIFDSNIKKDLESANLNVDAKPFVFALGEGMFLKGVEDFLVGKPEISADYKIELPPEKAFGLRDSRLVQLMPSRVFREHDLNPIPGMSFNFDGRMGKVLSASSGRVIVDFNNPVAGKAVVYDVKLLKKVDDIFEKAKSLINFFFRRDLKFEISENKLVLEVEKDFAKLAELFSEKFKELLGMDLHLKEIEGKQSQ